MERLVRVAAVVFAGLVAVGCDSGRTDPPNANVLVVHADPALGSVVFRRVKANETPLEYKQAAGFSFDVDTYTFNFDVLAPDETVTRTVSVSHTLEEETDYIVVLRDAGGKPTPQVIGSDARTGAVSGTQIQLLHAASSLGAVDVFIEPDGFDLASATPAGTLANGDVLPPIVLTNGDYQFVLTEANNRSNVLLRSDALAVDGTRDAFLYIADGANESLAPIVITLVGADVDLIDENLQTGLSVLNAVADRTAIDAGIDMALSPPLIPNVAFGTATDPVLIAPGEHSINITPAGDPGVIEVDETFTAIKGTLGTWFVSGAPGMRDAMLLGNDFRVISGEAMLRLFNASPINGSVDVFVVAPGTMLGGTTPRQTIVDGEATSNRRILPGNYDLTIRDSGTETVLFGPSPITLAADGYYGILITDAASGAGVDVQYLYDFD